MVSREFYFKNLRLKSGIGGRFLVRLAVYGFYGSLTASALVLPFAELRWMQSAGVFVVLFLIDRALHINQAEEKLSHMPRFGKINLDEFLSPQALTILEKSLEKSSFVGGNVFLWAVKQCLAQPEVKRELFNLNATGKEVEKKINKQLKQDKERKSKKELILLIENFVKSAAELAIADGADYIMPKHLFLALKGMENVKIVVGL